ncbi:MAG: undecaprenyl-diphosphate phosphatase [Mariniphaga sp.]|nr:undecaprenyl-diphosphate phosphatase [Mariniphaga sp.]MDD4226454.1 undecaprenyl-diphosphate phosphatase [Mariniphaga sp.]
MNEIQALILGILQGLTEFLPISSSGHLEIGNAVLGVQSANNLIFAVVVHVATVLSTLVVFRKDIIILLTDFFSFQWNESTKYILMLLFSAIPVLIIGLFFKDRVESFFTGNLVLVGSMLLITSGLLTLAHFAKKGSNQMTWGRAFIIGVAQALAVLPGISRSGATIATGIMLGSKRDEVARFSFLMVLVPILGAAVLNLLSGDFSEDNSIGIIPLLIGFVSAFLSGLLACSLMIRMVKKRKLIYFAIYCLIVGIIAIFAA